MQEKKCPNCGARMTISKAGTMWTCPYCDSRFEAEDEDKNHAKDGILNPEMFCIERDLERAMERKNTCDSINTCRYCLNELQTAEAVEEYIRKGLINCDEAAALGVNQERMDISRERFEPELEGGERIVLYGDTSVFGKGKSFYLLTNKRCLFFEKKKVKSVRYEDLTSVLLDDGLNLPIWYLNGDRGMGITAVGGKYQLQGAVLALICLFSLEENPGRARIRLV